MPPPARLTFPTARHPTTAECTEPGCLFGAAGRTTTDAAGANRLFNVDASILCPVAVPIVESSFDAPCLSERAAEHRNPCEP